MPSQHLIHSLESRLLFARPYGVDISHYQTVTSWTSMKTDPETPIQFVFIKATEGMNTNDANFSSFASGAATNGVPAGFYHFAHPELYPSIAQAQAEADHFLTIAKSSITAGRLPPVLDMEAGGGTLTNNDLCDWTNAWCQRVYDSVGVKPLIYCNTNYAANYLTGTGVHSVTGWPLWIANYPSTNTSQTGNPGSGTWGSGNWKFWQYTDGGANGVSNFVNGVGACDTDVFRTDSGDTLANWVILDKEVTVLDGATNIADGQASAVSFGTVSQGGASAQQTFTVRNDGDLLLTLSALTVPTGYSIVSNFGSTSLHSGESTTFVVRLDSAVAGTKTGNIQFTCNDANEAAYDFPVTGLVNGLAAPSNLQVTGSTYNSVGLSWTDNSSTETSFRIERKTGSGGTYAEIGFASANATTYTDLTAPGGSQLYYRVRAYDGTQYSSYATEVNITTPVQTPQNLSASDNLYDKVAITWSAAAGANSYQIFRGTTSDSASASFLISTTQLSYNDADAIGNVTYYYFVRGVSSLSTASAFSAPDTGIKLVDNIAPTSSSQNFYFDSAPQQVRLSFSESVQGSLDVSDVTITRVSDNVTIIPTAVTWDSGTNTAGFSLPADIAIGNYHANFNNAGIKDAANNPLSGTYSLDFFILPGDANRDRKVDTTDFNIVAGNFGQLSGATFSIGDFSLDGAIDSVDFGILVSNYGTTLPAPSAPLAIACASPSLFGTQSIQSDRDNVLA